MFTYKASRHHAPVQAEYETIDECVERARSDMDNDAAWPVEVLDAEGRTVLSMDELHVAIAKQSRLTS